MFLYTNLIIWSHRFKKYEYVKSFFYNTCIKYKWLLLQVQPTEPQTIEDTDNSEEDRRRQGKKKGENIVQGHKPFNCTDGPNENTNENVDKKTTTMTTTITTTTTTTSKSILLTAGFKKTIDGS